MVGYKTFKQDSLFDWKDKVRDFIVTADLNNDGTIKGWTKDGKRKNVHSCSIGRWLDLTQKKTESDIKSNETTVGTYIYNTLAKIKRRKSMVNLCRQNGTQILQTGAKSNTRKTKEFHSELNDTELYHTCLNELYGNNEAHRNSNANRDFTYLLLNGYYFLSTSFEK